MALITPSKPVQFEIAKDIVGNVESLTVDGVHLPLRHVKGYAITESATEPTEITVTFFARPVFTYREDLEDA